MKYERYQVIRGTLGITSKPSAACFSSRGKPWAPAERSNMGTTYVVTDRYCRVSCDVVSCGWFAQSDLERRNPLTTLSTFRRLRSFLRPDRHHAATYRPTSPCHYLPTGLALFPRRPNIHAAVNHLVSWARVDGPTPCLTNLSDFSRSRIWTLIPTERNGKAQTW